MFTAQKLQGSELYQLRATVNHLDSDLSLLFILDINSVMYEMANISIIGESADYQQWNLLPYLSNLTTFVVEQTGVLSVTPSRALVSGEKVSLFAHSYEPGSS